MILKNGVSTIAGSRPERYCSPIAAYLDSLWSSGKTGDEAVFSNGLERYVRYGRRVLRSDSEGYMFVWRFTTQLFASQYMSRIRDDMTEGR